ncbi:MAG: hypothetical protein L6V88_00065 [Anaerotruncus sp.]|nr:MAG: hypothetical protein L6V88_00065 [Anaerotruncus sp.]
MQIAENIKFFKLGVTCDINIAAFGYIGVFFCIFNRRRKKSKPSTILPNGLNSSSKAE